MGPSILEQTPLNLEECYNESLCNNPLIFVLSPESDPLQILSQFSNKVMGKDKFETLSLGQGQGNKAKDLIKRFQKSGGWVCL
jgi:dynein heavy chain, axonemal